MVGVCIDFMDWEDFRTNRLEIGFTILDLFILITGVYLKELLKKWIASMATLVIQPE